MRDEPEITGLWMLPGFSFRWCRRAEPAAGFWGFVFLVLRERNRRCGNVGISSAVGEIPKGLVERVGSLPLAFHSFHSAGISTALFHRGLRHRANRLSLAFCIRRAVSVPLLAAACCCSMLAVIASFKDFSHSGSDVSFS